MTRAARIWIGIAAIYGFMAIFTFGHCGAHHPVAPTVFSDGTKMGNGELTAMGSLGAAALWPLYWSWELQR